MFDLTGRTALVTGASGGIGSAIATALAARGARVALAGRRREALESVASTLEGAVVVVGELADAAETDALVAEAEGALGRIDILVNNAGLTRDNLFLRMKDAEWDEVLAVNLTAAFRLSRSVLRGMMKRRHGRIVGISSVVGHTGNGGQANYAASKAGLAAMTKSLAQEVGSRGITVNCIAPGFVETAMTDALPEDRRAALVAAIPVGRMGAGADVAAAAVYLASDEAAWVTGQTLHVNGGMAMP